jgi:hypothetical protein
MKIRAAARDKKMAKVMQKHWEENKSEVTRITKEEIDEYNAGRKKRKENDN